MSLSSPVLFSSLTICLFLFPLFFLSPFPTTSPTGGPAELCWFQVLHREPHEEPRRPEPEAGSDLPALQQDHGETRPDLRQEHQRQWRWWGQVWYERTPVHLTDTFCVVLAVARLGNALLLWISLCSEVTTVQQLKEWASERSDLFLNWDTRLSREEF